MNEMLHLADMINQRTIGMIITFLGEMRFMDKREPCFCGSGKTGEHCHSNINERSLVARVLSIYKETDIRNSHAKTICKKGCSECCQNEDIEIHLSEMLTIMSHLGIGRDGQNSRLFPELKRDWHLCVRGSCLFLDQKERYCKIYEVRPVVCRNYGSVLQDTIVACSPIYNAHNVHNVHNTHTLHLIDEDDYSPINTTSRIIFAPEDGKLKPLTIPMTVWFKELVDNNRFNNTDAMQLLEYAAQRPVSEFVKVIQSQATNWWKN